MTRNEIVSLYGTPVREDHDSSDYMDYFFGYSHFCLYMSESSDNPNILCLDGFATDSEDFFILNNVVPSGIRVGDSLSKLQNCHFENTPYGRNKPGNALRQLSSSEATFISDNYDANYVIYAEEFNKVYLCVRNNIVVAFLYSTELDWDPDEPYIPFW